MSDKCPMIAPVCGMCGREIDKTPIGWVHVLDHPQGFSEDTVWTDGGGMTRESQREMNEIADRLAWGSWRAPK